MGNWEPTEGVDFEWVESPYGVGDNRVLTRHFFSGDEKKERRRGPVSKPSNTRHSRVVRPSEPPTATSIAPPSPITVDSLGDIPTEVLIAAAKASIDRSEYRSLQAPDTPVRQDGIGIAKIAPTGLPTPNRQDLPPSSGDSLSRIRKHMAQIRKERRAAKAEAQQEIRRGNEGVNLRTIITKNLKRRKQEALDAQISAEGRKDAARFKNKPFDPAKYKRQNMNKGGLVKARIGASVPASKKIKT